jgi:hypothetical protein
MLLNEFFGRAIKTHKDDDKKRDDSDDLLNRLFYYTLENDKIYKQYFIPLADKIKNESMGKDQCVQEFMPMVKRSCKEFYARNKMKGNIKTVFPKSLREELCEKLYDHYHEGILKNEYKI